MEDRTSLVLQKEKNPFEGIPWEADRIGKEPPREKTKGSKNHPPLPFYLRIKTMRGRRRN